MDILNKIETQSREKRDSERLKAAKKQVSKSKSAKRIKPPIDIFPEVLQNILTVWQNETKLPMDYYLANALAAMATAAGNSFQATVQPEWNEPLIFWFASIGPPSFGKTPVTKKTLEPIFFNDDMLNNEYEKYNTSITK